MRGRVWQSGESGWDNLNAVAKILWLHYHNPRVFGVAHRFIHVADFIVGRLTGEYDGVSDSSNALKTGYDLHRHPDGYWLPGGASNTGGEAIVEHFPRAMWDRFDGRR